jgi:hypothetical protein
MHEAVRKYLAAIGRRGGQATSLRKTETARANGKLGGRRAQRRQSENQMDKTTVGKIQSKRTALTPA